MTLGHADDITDVTEAGMERAAHQVMDAAYALGIRHYDAARSYGLAESFLGRWLSARRVTDITVSSKWGYRYAANWQRRAEVHEVKDHSLPHFESQWRQSKEQLGPWLEIYQVHSLTTESPALTNGPLLDALAKLRDSGVAIGASVSGPQQAEVIDALIDVNRGGGPLFTWVQATWNVLERSSGPALTRAKAAGLRVIIKEALANGRLTARGNIHTAIERAASLRVPVDALCLSIARAQPFADVVLSGAATDRQVQSNAQWVPVSALELSELECAPQDYWRERSALVWT
jgi:aryl-alcohol dehydrogenase-like predicted oxidoreductase